MIKTALKHFIYEICIEQIFTRIQENFAVFENNPTDQRLVVGELYDVIIVVDHKFCRVSTFRDVIVEAISTNYVSLYPGSITHNYSKRVVEIMGPTTPSLVKTKEITQVGKPEKPWIDEEPPLGEFVSSD